MPRSPLLVLALLAVPPAVAQPVYRTGSSYTDQPGGSIVYLVDNRVQAYPVVTDLYRRPHAPPPQRTPPPRASIDPPVYTPPPRITIVLPPVYIVPQHPYRIHHHSHQGARP